ncbi:hypothetical protein SAMN05444166_5144 [Singulisphaera sp. GP187]|uniref:hypothetical protein n=1 Tax=Singulisphaera sp. GP187 TaxID=1882752 RepID=UPI000926EE9D|nr:hypothetical protein [Singulisphaera sp. GP187]SIO55802.1 hypothetical protein SAMN05444166_5144 [Singulisphaera sp. GP187]
MTIQLPKELVSSIEAVVHSGRFAKVDKAMAEAARLLLRNYKQPVRPVAPTGAARPIDPILGSIDAMHEDGELLDVIVANAYQRRREDKGREFVLLTRP